MAKNISKNYVSFSRKNIYEYFKIIMDKKFDKDIVNELIDTYISVRYYNYYPLKYTNKANNIKYYINSKVDDLVNLNKDKEDIIKNSGYMFKYIMYFDDVLEYRAVDDLVSELEEDRSNKINIFDDEFSDNMVLLIKANNKRKRIFLSSLKNDNFDLVIRNTNIRNVFMTNLKYNFSFPRIYSEYSKKKVFNEGIINEDKLMILYNLINLEVLKNVISSQYDKKYIVDFPVSIFEKVDKINWLLDTIDDDTVRDNIIMKITYSNYLLNKDKVEELIKDGYKFACIIDSKFEYNNENMIWLNIFSYVISDKEESLGLDDIKVIVD